MPPTHAVPYASCPHAVPDGLYPHAPMLCLMACTPMPHAVPYASCILLWAHAVPDALYPCCLSLCTFNTYIMHPEASPRTYIWVMEVCKDVTRINPASMHELCQVERQDIEASSSQHGRKLKPAMLSTYTRLYTLSHTCLYISSHTCLYT